SVVGTGPSPTWLGFALLATVSTSSCSVLPHLSPVRRVAQGVQGPVCDGTNGTSAVSETTPPSGCRRSMARMLDMRIDHISYAAGPDGLLSTAKRIGELLGEDFRVGGIHPRFGTRNMVLPLSDGTYVEIVEVLDHPASDKAPFGQAVRARSELGGGWMGWVVSVPDIATVAQRLGRES